MEGRMGGEGAREEGREGGRGRQGGREAGMESLGTSGLGSTLAVCLATCRGMFIVFFGTPFLLPSVSVVILANNALRAHHARAHGGILNICLNVF